MSDAERAVVRQAFPTPAWMDSRGGRPEGYCHRQKLNAVRYLLSALCAFGAGVLSRLDNASTPTSVMRAGATFGACLTVCLTATARVWR
ncbi:hypothetical protein ACO0M4_25730 [Streptomyces sp. RGM 3693]|uniref:hypothetical protein n=1 Tax=Streptomyces sp. RGM 3693 TaxID=3413284 RepID=UPI003D2E5BE4